MKRTITIVVLCALAASLAFAAPKTPPKPKVKPVIGAEGYAIGAFLGEPSGLTFRAGISKTQTLEAKAAWSLGGSSSVHLEANWLTEFQDLLIIEGERFIPYLGAGALFEVSSAPVLGIHMPAGIVYRFQGAPFELALEVDIGMNFLPATDVNYGGGLAFRWRFQPQTEGK